MFKYFKNRFMVLVVAPIIAPIYLLLNPDWPYEKGKNPNKKDIELKLP